MNSYQQLFYKSPIGWIRIKGDEEFICRVNFSEFPGEKNHTAGNILQACAEQLDEYFRKRRTSFSLKLKPEGSGFQRQVWERLLKVPYGKTATYLEIAASLGDPNSVRAVGNANGKNPIAIIIPCHRVIGRGGKLIGYGGGIWRKEWLLKHEGGLLV